jgi:hypothetical protein
MNIECHFCTESISFYNKLAEPQQGVKAARIIAIFPNEEGEVKKYAQYNRLQLETISGVNFKALNISGTPTMILVDDSGKVVDFWIGKLSKDNEHQIIKTLAAS